MGELSRGGGFGSGALTIPLSPLCLFWNTNKTNPSDALFIFSLLPSPPLNKQRAVRENSSIIRQYQFGGCRVCTLKAVDTAWPPFSFFLLCARTCTRDIETHTHTQAVTTTTRANTTTHREIVRELWDKRTEWWAKCRSCDWSLGGPGRSHHAPVLLRLSH